MKPVKLDNWDFSKIPADQIADALRYECLRSSPTAIMAADHLRMKLGTLTKPKVESFVGDGSPLEERLGEKLLAMFLFGFPDFPRPYNPRRRRIVLQDSGGVTLMRPDDEWAALTLSQPSENLKLLPFQVRLAWIDLKRPTDQLIDAFAAWVKREKDRLKLHARRGRGGPSATKAPVEKLKWLAALRLHDSGMSHADSQEFLRSERVRHGIRGELQSWPFYDDSASWSRAIGKARRLIKEAEKTFGLISGG